MNEISADGATGNALTVDYCGRTVAAESVRYDVIYPTTAKVLADISSIPGDPVIMTCNQYGKGQAYYLGLPAGAGLMGDILDDLISELGIRKGPDVPAGVMARDVDPKHSLYLNATGQVVEIKVPGKAKGLITGKSYKGVVAIPPFEVEFIEKQL